MIFVVVLNSNMLLVWPHAWREGHVNLSALLIIPPAVRMFWQMHMHHCCSRVADHSRLLTHGMCLLHNGSLSVLWLANNLLNSEHSLQLVQLACQKMQHAVHNKLCITCA